MQFGQKSWQGGVGEEEGIAEALIISNSNLIGSTLKDIRFRQRYNVTVLAIRRGQELLRDSHGKSAPPLWRFALGTRPQTKPCRYPN